MKNILILGAGGKVARHVIDRLRVDEAVHLTLYLRKAERLQNYQSSQVQLVEGDILDTGRIIDAMTGQDIVYVNINGREDELARQVVKSMIQTGVNRLIFIASIGIYDEVPGEFGKWNKEMIGPYIDRYRKAADFIEASALDYTILRPAWYTDKDEVEYELTQKGEEVKGTEISRKSVADMVVNLIHHPQSHVRESLGLEKPGTEGPKPAFM